MCFQMIFQSEQTTNIMGNQKIIFILKKKFLEAMTQLPLCPFAVDINMVKHWLCTSEVNSTAKLVDLFIDYLSTLLYNLTITLLKHVWWSSAVNSEDDV